MMCIRILGVAALCSLLAMIYLPGANSQNNVTIGFLLDVSMSINKSIFEDWGACCCNNVSAQAIVDVQYIHPFSPFNTQVETFVTTGDRDVTVVVPSHCDVLPTINSVAAAAGGNLVAMTPLYCWTAASIAGSDSVPPSLTPLMGVIHAFITKVGWTEVVIYHDHQHESILSAILHTVTEVTFKPINITGMSDQILLDILIDTHVQNPILNQYMTLCDLAGITQVFKQAQKIENVIDEQGFIDYYSKWLLVTEETSLSSILSQITDIRNVDAIVLHPRHTNVNMENFINQNLNALKLIVEDIVIGRGLLNCDNSDCLNMHVVPSLTSDVYIVKGAWEILQNGIKTTAWSEVATWSEQNGLQIKAISLYPASSYGFNQKRLKIGTINRKPYTVVNESATTQDTRYSGFCMALLKELALTLNFSYDIVTPDDNSIGIYKTTSGSWNGLVNMLKNKEIDLAVAPMAVTKDRSAVIDFTYPFHVDQYGILYKRIDSASMKWRLMIEPFKWAVWSGVILSVFVVAVFVWITSKYTPFYTDDERDGGLGSKGYALFYTYGALLQQGCVYEPRALSSRFVVGFWWFYCMCVIATYQGNLIAFLTVPIEFLPFESINELIYSNKFKYGFVGNTGLEPVLQNATEKLYMDMWEKVQTFATTDPTVLDTNVTLHIDRVANDENGYAFFSDKTTIQESISDYCGRMNMLYHNIWMVQYAIAFPTGSTYPRMFSDLLLQLHEGGLIDTWRFRYFKQEDSCTKSENLAKAVTTDDLFGPLMTFVVLLVVCLAVFVVEHYCRYRRRKKFREMARITSADSQAKIVDGVSTISSSDDSATPEINYPPGHDPYSVDPELLQNKDLYNYGVGKSGFDGNFYGSEQFHRKVQDVRDSYSRSKDNRTKLSHAHGGSSRASRRSPCRSRAAGGETSRSIVGTASRVITNDIGIIPVESPTDY